MSAASTATAEAAQVEAQVETIKSWLLAKKPGLEEIDPDLDLIENRIIDSLGFLDFVYFLEEVTGRELAASTDSVTAFRTLRGIRENILVGGS